MYIITSTRSILVGWKGELSEGASEPTAVQTHRYDYAFFQTCRKVPETCLSCGVKSYFDAKTNLKKKYSIVAEKS